MHDQPLPVGADVTQEPTGTANQIDCVSVAERAVGPRFVAVTVDITDDEDPAVSAVVRKYAVEGLPLIIAFDSAGNEALRLPNLPDASEIASRLRSVR